MSLAKSSTCAGCLGMGWGCTGFTPSTGTGTNGVLLIGEASGEQEALEGKGFIGKAGFYLFQQLGRIGIERDGFRLANVLYCRPYDNKLAGMPYEQQVIDFCAPNLDRTIAEHSQLSIKLGLTPVIVCLGKVAIKRVMGWTERSPEMKVNYQAYPLWNQRYGSWTFAVDHPSFLMRGNHHLTPILQATIKRALQVAKTGLTLDSHPGYLLDPLPEDFSGWAQPYLSEPSRYVLSYDIETPYKQGEDEEDVAREDQDDYTILRCSFAYQPGISCSVPWTAPYLATMRELFAAPSGKISWNGRGYDDERVIANGVGIKGDRLDAMLAWHVLNSALPKGLGFVTPFYWQTTGMWKHLSSQAPAFYNCKDADAALRCWHGIEADLRANHQWKVFEQHVIKLNRVFDYMSSKGVLRDEILRRDAETKLAGELAEVDGKIEQAIPDDARRIAHVYKTTPKDTTGLLSRRASRLVPTCPQCGLERPGKPHFRVLKKRVNACGGLAPEARQVEVDEYYRLADWKVSKLGLTDYQRAMRHQPVMDRRTKKVTFDETAIIKLRKRYPKDGLYPLILEQRGLTKMLSTYIGVTQLDGSIRGGMPVGKDGRIHTTFTTDADTLRSTSRNPNLQSLTRPKGPDDNASIIRNLVIPAPGMVFTARDYSGIEAVLVGYEAQSERYIRLAKLDVHSYYTAYALHELDGSVSSQDLPDITWSDEKLIECLAGLKKRLKEPRNNLYKHLVHGANFFQGAKGAQEKILNETGIAYPVELVKKVMDIYFALFPEIRKWHHDEMLRADRDGFTRNAFGYIRRWRKIFDYEDMGNGVWQKEPGPESNQCIAFKPQSNAAGIIKEAMSRIYYNRFEEAGQYLRLLVHDELLLECPAELREQVDAIVKEEMEKPIMAMELPWKPGEYLTINTEDKWSPDTWGKMK